jgi:hypothetical protein
MTRCAVTARAVERWFIRHNRGKPHNQRTRPFGFLISPTVTGFANRSARAGNLSTSSPPTRNDQTAARARIHRHPLTPHVRDLGRSLQRNHRPGADLPRAHRPLHRPPRPQMPRPRRSTLPQRHRGAARATAHRCSFAPSARFKTAPSERCSRDTRGPMPRPSNSFNGSPCDTPGISSDSAMNRRHTTRSPPSTSSREANYQPPLAQTVAASFRPSERPTAATPADRPRTGNAW